MLRHAYEVVEVTDGYGKIMHDRLWTVVTVYVPQLIRQLASYASALPEPSKSGWENER